MVADPQWCSSAKKGGLLPINKATPPRRAFRIYGSRSRCTIRRTVPWWVGNSALLRSAAPYGGGAIISVFQLTEDVRLVGQCLLITLPSSWFIHSKYITLYFWVGDSSKGNTVGRHAIHFGMWRCWDFNMIFWVTIKIREMLLICVTIKSQLIVLSNRCDIRWPTSFLNLSE